jgi:hypothetical protein
MKQVKFNVGASMLNEVRSAMSFLGTHIVSEKAALAPDRYIVIIEGSMFPDVPELVEVVPVVHHNSELGTITWDWKYAGADELFGVINAKEYYKATQKVSDALLSGIDYMQYSAGLRHGKTLYNKHAELLSLVRRVNARIVDYLGDPFPTSTEEMQVEFSELVDELQDLIRPVLEEYDAGTNQ